MPRLPSDPPRTPLEKMQLESGLNQTEFADRVKMDRPVVNQYLSGERSLGEKNAKRFAEAMGVPEAWRGLVTKRTAAHVRSLEARLQEAEEQAAERAAEHQDLVAAHTAATEELERLDAADERLTGLIADLTARVEHLEGGASQRRGEP